MRIPGTLKHLVEASSDSQLEAEAHAHAEHHPGVRFLADVLVALHQGGQALRGARDLYAAFAPREVLEAFAQRPDLRVKVVRAITGGPGALLRRLTPADLATQVELLASEDLPASERQVRAEDDRALSIPEIYLKHLQPLDLSTYLPARRIWQYESQDSWWTQDPTPGARALMAAELRSTRLHRLVPDSEILDLIGDEQLERDLPLAVRTRLRSAARKAGSEGRAFRDSDLFAALRSPDGSRDLVDDLADNVPLPVLRKVVARAMENLGLTAEEMAPAAGAAAPEAAAKPAATPTPPAATPTPPAAPPSKRIVPRTPASVAAGARTPPPPVSARNGGKDSRSLTPPPVVPSAKGNVADGDNPFASGPPIEHEILAIMDDLAAPEITISGEETSETRR
jgi:hypothetical protein